MLPNNEDCAAEGCEVVAVEGRDADLLAAAFFLGAALRAEAAFLGADFLADFFTAFLAAFLGAFLADFFAAFFAVFLADFLPAFLADFFAAFFAFFAIANLCFKV